MDKSYVEEISLCFYTDYNLIVILKSDHQPLSIRLYTYIAGWNIRTRFNVPCVWCHRFNICESLCWFVSCICDTCTDYTSVTGSKLCLFRLILNNNVDVSITLRIKWDAWRQLHVPTAFTTSNTALSYLWVYMIFSRSRVSSGILTFFIRFLVKQGLFLQTASTSWSL
jgi:hypothetical protein